MGDTQVRRPMAGHFEKIVDFGLIIHCSPFMAYDKDPLFLSNHIFQLLEVNSGVARFLIQLHPENVQAVVESVTAHGENMPGRRRPSMWVRRKRRTCRRTRRRWRKAGGARGQDKLHHPLVISVQKVRMKPGKGKGKTDGWFPQPLTHNTRRVCTEDPATNHPMHSLCPTRKWDREWYGVTTPNIVSAQWVILFLFGATPPPIREAEEVVVAEPIRAFNRDPMDLVVTTADRLVVNHLLEHDFLRLVQLESLLEDLEMVPLSEKASIFNENPLIVGRPQDFGALRHILLQLWRPQTTQAQPPQAPESVGPQKDHRSCA